MDIHKRENLDIAFRFMAEVEKIPLVNIGECVYVYGCVCVCTSVRMCVSVCVCIYVGHR